METNKRKGNAKEKKETHPWHGFLGSQTWPPPLTTQHCDEDARPGYSTEKAHEYEDNEEVLGKKVLLLADLMQRSRNCLIYSGAGLSTASGISDYATKSNTKFAAKKKSGYSAQPTFAHKALVAMQKGGHIKHWVQQNHDGLPQKAGLPQQCLNEIHGAWYDPTNPVVPMKGSLRGDLFEDMLVWEQRADLTLSVGTSMCGMNSDRVFTTVSEKSIDEQKQHRAVSRRDNKSDEMEEEEEESEREECKSLGGVIIGIQKTQYDSLACLHIFARIDRVMALLLHALDLPPPPSSSAACIYSPDIAPEYTLSPAGRFLVCYDDKGHLLCPADMMLEGAAATSKTVLDLRVGSRVRMVSGPYKGDRGVVVGVMTEGHYQLEFTHTLDYRQCQTVAPYKMGHILGCWYVEAAVKGTLPAIPIVNC